MTKPVLVVGAGPVGLTMAAELARYRTPVRIIDQATARTEESKALGVWPRTLELLDRAGSAEAFTATGLKSKAVSIQSGAERIAHITFDALPSPYPYLLLIPQPESERLLERRLQTFGIKVERGIELTSFAELADGVSCDLRHADGSSETLEAGWLIGCDGAHSTVRHKLGMAFEGDTLASTFVLADVHVAGLDAPKDEVTLYWSEDGIMGFFPISPPRYRIIADVGQNPRHDPTLEEVQAIVDRRGPGGVGLSNPLWLSGFSVNERKVETYRAGRVFLAGDAAHVHSPAGGQGMNTGMQDAFNLAWKLALVERGLARPDLLDSYSEERSAVAKQVLADSGRLTRAAMLQGPILEGLRNFVARHLLGFADLRRAFAERMAEVAIDYPASPISRGSGRGLGGPAPGHRIVAGRPFGAGDTPRFALMAAESDEARGVLHDYAPLIEPDLRSPPDAAGVWLVRPDGYVAAAARAGDWGPIRACLADITIKAL
jgi:2-polyprenyl-6-methoxyphenol hydroxylase-like FAD-dependent oxidoreductase